MVSHKDFLRKKRYFIIEFLAVIVGAIAGLGAVLFRATITFTHRLFFDDIGASTIPLLGNGLGIIVLPALGGLIVGLIVHRYAREVKGHGVPEVMEAVNLKGGVIRARVALAKIIASSITIGSGGSAGREGPIAQIGAGLGSMLATRLGLTFNDRRMLVVCGLSAGIGATFNAPLGGAIFGMEVILRRFQPANAIPIILSSVVGTAVGEYFLGVSPAFNIPSVAFKNPLELFLYLALGIVFGFLAFLWVRIFYVIEDAFEAAKTLPLPLKTTVGGFLTGLIGYSFLDYGILGVGYEGIDAAFSQHLPLTLLITLATLKILATAFTIGSGGSGGIFAPSLYIGGMLGLAFGGLATAAYPALSPSVLAYGLAGMGALFAGAAGAPFTCVIMIPEMANNYHLIPPLMVACVSSYIVAFTLLKGSGIYLLKLEKRGIDMLEREAEAFDVVQIGDVMHQDVDTVTPKTTVEDLSHMMIRSRHLGYPVLDGDELTGIITFNDIRGIPPKKRKDVTVGDVLHRDVISILPTCPVRKGLLLLDDNNIGRLPVVDLENPKKLIGIVTRTDLLHAYQIGRKRLT